MLHNFRSVVVCFFFWLVAARVEPTRIGQDQSRVKNTKTFSFNGQVISPSKKFSERNFYQMYEICGFWCSCFPSFVGTFLWMVA